MKKMVITGVNGFIGRHAKEYFEKEYEITGLDLAANYCGDRQPGDTMAYYQCNMSQESAEMAAIFTGVQPDVILHCAGSANVGASVVNPMADLDGNLHSLYQLLLALKSFEKRPQIIFLSSAGIYGNPRQLPVRESDAAAPMSPYGLHKHMAEELCEYYNRIHGYRIRSIRIFLLTATDCASSCCGTSIRNIRTPEESNCSEPARRREISFMSPILYVRSN